MGINFWRMCTDGSKVSRADLLLKYKQDAENNNSELTTTLHESIVSSHNSVDMQKVLLKEGFNPSTLPTNKSPLENVDERVPSSAPPVQVLNGSSILNEQYELK